MLHEAINFLKPLGADIYSFHEGRVYARSNAILAAYLVPALQGTFALAADDLEKALARMKEPPVISAQDGSLVLKAGRLKSSIRLMKSVEWNEKTGDDFLNVSENLFEVMEKARSFAGKDNDWKQSIKILDDTVLAINGRSCIKVSLKEDTKSSLIFLPETISWLAKSKPIKWGCGGSNIIFKWDNEAFAKCQFLTTQWPEGIFDRILANAYDGEHVTINDAWREAFAHASALGTSGEAVVSPQGISVKSANGEHVSEFQTGTKGTTTWSIEALKPVIEIADTWSPDTPSGVSMFKAKDIVGAIAALRR